MVAKGRSLLALGGAVAIKVSEKPTDLEQGLNMATIKKAVEAFIDQLDTYHKIQLLK